jgi:hypothetical protein
MREPQVVDHAEMHPYACQCGNTSGPLLDTFVENHAGRIYVCRRCAKTYSRLFGFARGKKLDELEGATVAVEAKDAEIARLVATISELRTSQRSEGQVVRELRLELEEALGRERARQHLAETLLDMLHLAVPQAVEAEPVVSEVVAA